jgi:glycine cleavage system H protein
MAPQDLKYTQEHEWIKVDGETATVGITDHAQEQLGDIVFVDLPEAGKEVSKGDEVVPLESAKAAASVYAPAAGSVIEGNDALGDNPALVNEDPFGQGWMYKMKVTSPGDLDGLMDAAAYEKFLSEQE